MGNRLDIPLPHSTYRLIVVIEGINHPGNLGAVCRAMLNHGFAELRLISPECSLDDDDARNRAKHAGSILDEAQVFTNWEDCMKDIDLVIGTSGKREIGSKVLFRHFLLPWELAEHIRDKESTIALVFGEEGKGLDRQQLESCDLLTTLPTWEGYPICNLSQAVGHFLYEIHRDRVKNETKSVTSGSNDKQMSAGTRKILRQAIEEFSLSCSGDDAKKSSIGNTLQRVVMRGSPLDTEAQRLIGSLVDATTALQKLSGDENWIKSRRRRIDPKEPN